MNIAHFMINSLESKKGRIMVLLLFALFIGLFMFGTEPTPIYYVVLWYLVVQGVFMYKSWGANYDFAIDCRKKLNPNFPLTPREQTEFFEKNPGQTPNTYDFYKLIWANYEDKKLNALAKRAKNFTIINFSLPLICFIVSIIVVNTLGWD